MNSYDLKDDALNAMLSRSSTDIVYYKKVLKRMRELEFPTDDTLVQSVDYLLGALSMLHSRIDSVRQVLEMRRRPPWRERQPTIPPAPNTPGPGSASR